MYKNKKIIAIIPARGGSKRIPEKNIRLLAGKPLIAYTILAAKESKYLDDFYVSTNSIRIMKVAKRYGAKIIRRPNRLATDKSPMIDVIIHSLDWMEKRNIRPEIIVVLQPTSPLRDSKDIDNAINLFKKSKCHSVVSVVEAPLFWGFILKGTYIRPIFSKRYLKTRSQNLPKTFLPNGAIFISTPENIRKYKSFYTNKTIPYIMPKEKSVDIDTIEDFVLAEVIIDGKSHKLEEVSNED